MSKTVKLLLTENVEALGIVGDVVSVRTGYARNYLLPRAMATAPSEEKVKELAAKRAAAERELAEQRKKREELAGKLQGVEVTLIRACNDQGVLYGSITQQDIATALVAMGHEVKPRDVRISQVMKRVDKYDVHVKLDSDLDSIIKLIVQADRKLEQERTEAEERTKAPAAEGQPAEGANPEPRSMMGGGGGIDAITGEEIRPRGGGGGGGREGGGGGGRRDRERGPRRDIIAEALASGPKTVGWGSAKKADDASAAPAADVKKSEGKKGDGKKGEGKKDKKK